MQDRKLVEDAFQFYVDELRRGSSDPYFAYRVIEQHWNVPGADQDILRQATIRLLEIDPWFVATMTPGCLDALQTEDLERLTPVVGSGPAAGVGALLRAMLWSKSRGDTAHLKRTLALLDDVPTDQRERSWQEMLVDCCRVLDYERYVPAFAKLLELTAPEWRAFGLIRFLSTVADRRDWPTYDRYRIEWNRLPSSHHACQCYFNQLHTFDGLRAVAADQWELVPEALAKAAAVSGCPHLNTGGLHLELTRVLVEQSRCLAEARVYLERAGAFGDTAAVAAVREQLEAARASSA